MASVQEIAQWIKQSFDSTETLLVENAIERALLKHGYERFAASMEAVEKVRGVLASLQTDKPETLPFEFSETNARRLIGKQRKRKGDSPETAQVRDLLALIPLMAEAVYKCGFKRFENICAKLMLLSGAEEVFVTGASDDGGIDVYGRIPLRWRDPHVREGLLHTNFLDKSLLFFGQCKCYQMMQRLGRPEIDSFRASADACLQKYEGNNHPPSNGVPSSYYRTQETRICVFFTTASFSEDAYAAANSRDIILVDGKQIADFLVYRQIGLKTVSQSEQVVDLQALCSWADAT